MKFKDMSWEELEKDFKSFLDSKTDDELFESLEKYINFESEYTYVINENNNLEEQLEYDKLDISNNGENVKVETGMSITSEEFDELEDAA